MLVAWRAYQDELSWRPLKNNVAENIESMTEESRILFYN